MGDSLHHTDSHSNTILQHMVIENTTALSINKTTLNFYSFSIKVFMDGLCRATREHILKARNNCNTATSLLANAGLPTVAFSHNALAPAAFIYAP